MKFRSQDRSSIRLVGVSRIQIELIDSRQFRIELEMMILWELDFEALLRPAPRRSSSQACEDVIVEFALVETSPSSPTCRLCTSRILCKPMKDIELSLDRIMS